MGGGDAAHGTGRRGRANGAVAGDRRCGCRDRDAGGRRHAFRAASRTFQIVAQFVHRLHACARFERARLGDDGAQRGRRRGGVGERAPVRRRIGRVHAGEHESEHAPDRVHVGAGVGGCESVLFRCRVPPCAERGRVAGASRVAGDGTGVLAGDAEVDEVRAVGGDDDVHGRHVAVDDAVRVEFADRLAQLDGDGRRLGCGEPSMSGHVPFECDAGHVVVDDHEPVGQFVGRLDAGQARRRAVGERRPQTTSGEAQWDLLADERAGAVQCDEFGDAGWPVSERAFDVVSVVQSHSV